MGRLEDIAARNRQANAGSPYGGITRLFERFHRPKPVEPDRPFQLRRARTTSPWLVIPVLLAIGALVGWRTCTSSLHTKTDYEKRMMGESP